MNSATFNMIMNSDENGSDFGIDFNEVLDRINTDEGLSDDEDFGTA